MENNPTIVETTADTVLEEIRRKAHFYVPEWTPGVEGDFGNALSRIFADMVEDIASNLNHAPCKHLFSFFNMLNFSPRSAQSARTVFCFVIGPGALENVIIPEKTRITAEGIEGEDIFFETEKAIEATPSKLCFVYSSNPQKDEIFDHSSIIDEKKPSTLFSGSSGKNLQEHIFYIGDEELFRTGKGKISLTLESDGSVPVRLLADTSLFSWEYAKFENEEETEEVEITEWVPFTKVEFLEGSGEKPIIPKIILRAESIIGTGKINGLESRWIRCLLKNSQMAVPAVSDNKVTEELEKPKILELKELCLGSVKVDVSAERIPPELLFYNDIPLEMKEEEIQPFGSKPLLNDTFYIACSEVFGRQGSEVRLDFDLIPGRASQLSEKPELSWEYWDGESWRSLKKLLDFNLNSMESREGESGKRESGEGENEKGDSGDGESGEREDGEGENGRGEDESKRKAPDLDLENFLENYVKEESEIKFAFIKLINGDEKEDENLLLVNVSVKIREMPSMKPVAINGVEDYWIRVRLIGGNFGKEYVLSKKNVIEPGKFYPPKIKNLKLSYCCREGKEPEYLVSKNNLTFEDKKKDLETNGNFKPFEMISEFPEAYFGFTSKLVKGPLSIFVKIEEICSAETTEFKWQYLSSIEEEGWSELQIILDETRGLIKSGILEFVVPEEMKALQLYGSKDSLFWIRIQFMGDEETLRTPIISGLYTNCVWALQARTIEDEILVSSSKETEHEFELMNRPVVNAEVWVNEVTWLPEREKVSLLKNRPSDVEAKRDDRGRFSEFWVRWEEVEDFGDSDGGSRHYLLDRNLGKIHFGNGIRGMIPPIGVNNIKASYRKGDGVAGNLEAFSITKLYSDLKYIDAVYNPIASEGGSEAESPEEMLEWAPAKFKNRGQAVTEEDILYLAREASKKVAKVKVLSGLDEEGNSDPGLITIIIVPDFPEPRPTPTDEIKQIVQAYLKERAPNTATLKIVSPVYHEVNVKVSLVSTDFETVSEIENRVKMKIEEFLHPLKGGNKGKGWDFGQFPSELDFYSLFSHLNGVSIENITIKVEKEVPEKSPEALELHSSCELALPCSGEHTINVSFPK